jgi:hypothetical protein
LHKSGRKTCSKSVKSEAEYFEYSKKAFASICCCSVPFRSVLCCAVLCCAVHQLLGGAVDRIGAVMRRGSADRSARRHCVALLYIALNCIQSITEFRFVALGASRRWQTRYLSSNRWQRSNVARAKPNESRGYEVSSRAACTHAHADLVFSAAVSCSHVARVGTPCALHGGIVIGCLPNSHPDIPILWHTIPGSDGRQSVPS